MTGSEPGLALRVRDSCAFVARHARLVRLAKDPVAYAAELLAVADSVSPPPWDEETHFRGEDEETVAYVLTLGAINFGSGYFPHLVKRTGHSGYFTIALALKERFERQGPYSARELEEIDPQRVAALLGQPPGDPVRDELMQHFATALSQLGSFLNERFAGSYIRMVGEARGSALRLADELTLMPYFRDISRYHGREVPFLKRAQITASDLALALGGAAPADFSDLDELTIFADNLVPHVLRCDGVLEYEAELSAHLARGELLPAGSPAEVEIRALAVHAVELMVAGLHQRSRPVSPRALDLLLWNRGQAPRYRGGSKHRTRTVFY